MSSEGAPDQKDTAIPVDSTLPQGAEIHFTDDRNAHVPDQVDILPGGWVSAIYKKQYEQALYPPDVIEGIYTHTTDEQEAHWLEGS